MPYIRILLFIILSISFLNPAYSQDLNISATVNKNVIALDEQLELNINISGDVPNIPSAQLPSLPNFTAYSAGRTQNVSIINGQASSTLSFRYILVPQSVGKFTLPPLILEHNGKTYKTDPINIEVVAQKSQVPAQQPQQGQPQTQQQAQGRQLENLFITASVDKNSVYVNEQITYIFRFYRRIRLLSNPSYSAPDFSGFWTEELPPTNYSTNIEGQTYAVSEVKTLLFPTQPGKFTLNSATLQCKIEDFSPQDFFADGFFSSFFSGGKTKVLNTEPITINVKPIPEQGKPSNFTGAVGKYTIKAELDKKKVKVNEPITLSLIISGEGNIKTISEPALPDWPDFRKYETVSSLSINKDAGIIQGTKTFKTVIVPQTQGHKTIPKIEFSFFDPKKNKYSTVATSPLSIDVAPAPEGSTTSTFNNGDNQIKVVSKDINYIKSLTEWDTVSGPIFGKKWFIILNLFPLFFLGFAFVYKNWQEKLSKDIAFARRLRATSTARKYLKQAQKLLNINNALEFYCALSRALLEYIANKMNVSADGLTTNTISDMLSKRNVNNDIIQKVKDILSECDLVRFAPTSVTFDMMQNSYKEVENIINSLEKVLRKKTIL